MHVYVTVRAKRIGFLTEMDRGQCAKTKWQAGRGRRRLEREENTVSRLVTGIAEMEARGRSEVFTPH